MFSIPPELRNALIIFLIAFVAYLVFKIYVYIKSRQCTGLKCLAFYSYDLQNITAAQPRLPTTRVASSGGLPAVLIKNVSLSGKTLKGMTISVSSGFVQVIVNDVQKYTVKEQNIDTYLDLQLQKNQSVAFDLRNIPMGGYMTIQSVSWS